MSAVEGRMSIKRGSTVCNYFHVNMGLLMRIQCNLDYPDLLETSRYISMHAQRACPVNFKGGVATVE